MTKDIIKDPLQSSSYQETCQNLALGVKEKVVIIDSHIENNV